MRRVLKNFGLNNVQMLTISSTSTSATTALPFDDMGDLMIYNPGPVDVYVRTGISTTVADTTALIIPAGEKGVYHKGYTTPPTTHIACYSASAQTIYVAQGYGS